jgi:hypothetical protein
VPGGAGAEAIGNPGTNIQVIGQDPVTNEDIFMSINGFTTGLQFRNEVRNQDQLYAVSQGGQFFRITPRDSDLSRPNDTNTQGAVGVDVHNEEVQISDARDFGALLAGRTLEGLAAAPVNLEGGRYQGMFFAVTNLGELICIDPDGDGDGNATLVDNVFDTDADGIADSWISNSTGLTNVRGFAFSQLDMNLWHSTNLREQDDGHGVFEGPDIGRNDVSQNNNVSMFFGLEGDDLSTAARWQNFDAGQYGVQSQAGNGAGTYNWQLDLASGSMQSRYADNTLLNANYNIAGGGHGSLITDPFSLAGYARTDKPTLYFNYFLDTEGQDASNQDANNDDNAMRDSARAFASRDGGVTWELIATNNSVRSNLNGQVPHAELAPEYTYSSQIGDSVENQSGERNQRVQELMDSTGTWRQARVDLADFANESSIVLRFDFSTGGDLDRNAVNNASVTPDALRAVTAAALVEEANGNLLVQIDSSAGVALGMQAMQLSQQDIAAGGTPLESVAEVVAINVVPDLGNPGAFITTVELEHSLGSGVTYQLLDADGNPNQIAFFSEAIDKDNIPSIASSIGAFDNPEIRSTNNDHEGFYVDDIIVGFAERGEMVVGSTDNPVFGQYDLTSNDNDYQEQILTGEYQLEIRRGTEYGQRAADDVQIIQPFDTNDRHIRNPAEAPVIIAENPLTTVDDVVLSSLGTTTVGIPAPVNTLLFVAEVADDETTVVVSDFSVAETTMHLLGPGMEVTGAGVPAGTVIVALTPERIVNVNNANSSINSVKLTLSQSVTLPINTQLTFTTRSRLEGVGGNLSPSEHNALEWAVDLEGQDTAFLEFNYAVDATEQLTILPATFTITDPSNVPSGDGVAISVDGGLNWTRLSNVTGTDGEVRSLEVDLSAAGLAFTADTRIGFFRSGRNVGGIYYGKAVIRTAPLISTTGLVGDRNIIREQGQFVIENNFISHAEEYGIRIDAARDAVTGAPTSGVARNLPVLNTDRLVPGVVVVNNIFADNGNIRTTEQGEPIRNVDMENTAGILFSGDLNTGNVAEATVPFGRLVNNTFYGNTGRVDQFGIQVTDNAGPTILNNVFAELGTGINVDDSSRVPTIIATSAFYKIETAKQVFGDDQQFPLVIDNANNPFVNAEQDNFYPTTGSEIIDSSLGSLQDRTAIRAVTEPVSISESPVLAPGKDIYGQLRADDPSQGNATGLGSNVFKDRGAVERVDEIGPAATLIGPLDGAQNPPIDLSAEVDRVRIVGEDAEQIFEFRIQLSDIGAGVDKETVDQDAVTVKRRDLTTPVESEQYTELLVQGTDYIFLYSKNTNQITLKSTSVYPLGDYLVELVPFKSITNPADNRFTDLAGNLLQSNTDENDSKVSFLINLENLPAAPGQLEGDLLWREEQSLSVVGNVTNQTLVTVNDITNVYVNMTVAGSAGVPAGTVITNINTGSNELTLSNNVTVTNGDQITVSAPEIAGQQVPVVNLQWQQPGTATNPLIDDFQVEKWEVGDYKLSDLSENWIKVSKAEMGLQPTDKISVVDPEVTVGGLLLGRTYQFRVAATSSLVVGTNSVGDYSDPTAAILISRKPTAPRAPDFGVEPNQLNLDWLSPVYIGGDSVNYDVQVAVQLPNGEFSNWITATDDDLVVTDLDAEVQGLIVNTNALLGQIENNKSYHIRVRARNAYGESDYVQGAGPLTPRQKAEAVTLQGEVADKLIKVWWNQHTQADLNDGIFVEYDIEVEWMESSIPYTAQLPSRTGNPTEGLPLEIEELDLGSGPQPLQNGVEYTVRVFVETDGGRGIPVEDQYVPATTPGAPIGLVAGATDSQVVLSWNPPFDNGGNSVLEYEIEKDSSTTLLTPTPPTRPYQYGLRQQFPIHQGA